ncbi:MAG: hypothetical protein ACTTIC_02725 [Helicobacteraceae bacterium]
MPAVFYSFADLWRKFKSKCAQNLDFASMARSKRTAKTSTWYVI